MKNENGYTGMDLLMVMMIVGAAILIYAAIHHPR